MAEAVSSDKYAAPARSQKRPAADPGLDARVAVAVAGPATPAGALAVLSVVRDLRAEVPALEAESTEATSALASGPSDLRRAEELRDRVASAAAELSSTEARARDQAARLAALRARRDALLGVRS